MAGWKRDVVRAVETNNVDVVKEFISSSKEKDMNVQDENGDTYLHVAIRVLCEKFLHYDIDMIHSLDIDWEIVKLFGKTVDKTLKNKAGELAAHILVPSVVKRPELKLLWAVILEEILTEEGINTECFIEGQYDLLNTALVHEDYDLVRVLLRKKIYVGRTDANGNTPLNLFIIHCSIRYPDYHEDILSALITPDTVNQRGNKGVPPLIYITRKASWSMISADIIFQAIQKGADITEVGSDNLTALAIALHTNTLAFDVMQALVHPSIVDLHIANDRAPLHLAANGGRSNVIRVLVEAGASVSVKDRHGLLPIHSYVQQDNACLDVNTT